MDKKILGLSEHGQFKELSNVLKEVPNKEVFRLAI